MIALVINPISGRGGRRPHAGPERTAVARRVLDHLGVAGVEIVVTEGRRHAAELAARFVARGFDRVIGWGGDGTINEVAGPLIGTSTALGVVPSGSGDGLARSLGLRRATATALTTAVRGPITSIDVGFLGDRHFLNIAGVGFDAAVGSAFNQRGKRGGLGYLTRGLTIVWGYQCQSYRVRLGADESTAKRFLIAFANGRQYGNGIVLAPDASLRDGWLDVVMVDAGSPLLQFWRSRRLTVRRTSPAKGILRTRVQSASVAGDRLLGHVDGESFETSGALEVSVRPLALRVVAPHAK